MRRLGPGGLHDASAVADSGAIDVTTWRLILMRNDGNGKQGVLLTYTIHYP